MHGEPAGHSPDDARGGRGPLSSKHLWRQVSTLILHEKGIGSKLSGIEVYYTACSFLVILKNSNSRFLGGMVVLRPDIVLMMLEADADPALRSSFADRCPL